MAVPGSRGGGGSFTRWLVARVGPSGAVVAADIGVRLLKDLEAPAEIDSPIFRGGSDAARFWSLTWLQVRYDAPSAQAQALDRGRAGLAE